MLDTLTTSIFATTMLFATSVMPAQDAAPTMSFTQVLPEKQAVAYTTGENESLASVSLRYYGSTEYWTNLWNENPSIKDPENVSKDTVLKVRVEKSEKPLTLKSELEKRNNDVIQQKNENYLKQIGYISTVAAAQPTVAPVQPKPAAPASVPSTISDEAITYLGNCEAGMNPAKNTGNGYYGAFQFSYGTWKSLNTGYERADLAPIDVQIAAVKQLLQRSSIFGQFPACANKMRNAGLI